MSPSVSVIIPARDAERTLARTLECLARQDTARPFEVIVVDDGSGDGTAAVAAAAAVEPLVLRQARVGAADARNRGVAAGKADLLAFLDADCYPEPGWLAAGMAALGHAGIVQGKVAPDPAAELGPFDRTLWVGAQDGLWQTANMFVRREVFDRIGGFEDWLPVELGKLMAEDVWFGVRATRAGVPAAFCADALVHHEVFPRGPRGYLAERRRTRYFPQIVRKAPELRRSVLFGRAFLSRRSAAFDAAAVALIFAAVSRSPLLLPAAVPYLALLLADGRLRGRPAREAGLIAAVDAAADALQFVELLRGSVATRSPVL